jgi:hypothetical protein
VNKAHPADPFFSSQALEHDMDLLFGRKPGTRRASDVLDNLCCRPGSPAPISVSCSLLMATMNQKSSLREKVVSRMWWKFPIGALRVI